jgi:hypothetical protein
MARSTQHTEDDTEYVHGVRKGTCPVCKTWGETKPKWPVIADPFTRKPDGRPYSLDEVRRALEDFRDRWNRGPFLHYQCALEKADILAGFNIETGEYDTLSNVVPLHEAAG